MRQAASISHRGSPQPHLSDVTDTATESPKSMATHGGVAFVGMPGTNSFSP